MKIVLTDHPWHELSIENGIFEAAGHELIAGPQTAGTPAEIEALVRQFDPAAIMTCWAPVSAAAIAGPTNLVIVSRLGVGLDNIAVSEAAARNAWVSNVPDYCVSEVADHALALVLSVERGTVALDRDVKLRGWHAPAWTPRRISQLTVGLIGYGRIGKETARRFAQLGCTLLAYSPSYREFDGVSQPATLEEIQERADIIILHAPLNAQTAHMLDAAFFARCRSKPVVVNVSRGGLIDNGALIDALERGLLRGAALDVVDGEPAPSADILRRADVIVTPHIAYLSDAATRDLRRTACEDVVRALRGQAPLHACSTPGTWSRSAPLPGGVSSDVEIQVIDGQYVVVKTALPQLKVAADWRSDPRRSGIEVRALRVAADLIGTKAVPAIIWEDSARNRFGMEYFGPPMGNWKQELLAGHLDSELIARAGSLLADLHRKALAHPALAQDFADTIYFEELRIRPFFETTARNLPAVAAEIQAASDELRRRLITLVHGDFSPKNFLTDGKNLVILDFEVAHWGDPAFDVAFFASHILLKSMHRPLPEEAFSHAVKIFVESYRLSHGIAEDDGHLTTLIACLMLARTDGDSPVDYLTPTEQSRARKFAMNILRNGAASVRDLLSLQEVAQ